MEVGSLFSGIGGLDLGLERAGMEIVWQVEIDDYCRRVLAKHWPNVKRYEDIRNINPSELSDVDLVCGGFPCQDISAAGQGVGIVGSRSGLWAEFARVLKAVRPRFAFIENVPPLRGKGLALVLQDLWSLGFDAEWHCIPASIVGAPYQRDRIYIVAYATGMFGPAIFGREQERALQAIRFDADADSQRQLQRQGSVKEEWQWISDGSAAAHFDSSGSSLGKSVRSHDESKLKTAQRDADSHRATADIDGEPLVGAAIARGERHAWTAEPGVVRMVSGIPSRVDRIRGLGNAVIPQVAEYIGRRILEADSMPTGAPEQIPEAETVAPK